MKLFLLGCDDDALALLPAWAAQPGHAVVAAFECGKRGPEVRAALPGTPLRDDWESLLIEARDGVVFVAGSLDREHRAEQLRRLVQERIAVWAVHPACESIVGYELEMIGGGSSSPLVPYLPGSRHPALAWLREAVRQPCADRLGAITSIALIRELPDTRAMVVERQLARDIYLITELLGDIENLGAFGASVESSNWSQLHVHVSNAAGKNARWEVASAASFGGRLEIVGESGRAVLELPGDPRRWHLDRVGGQTRSGYQWDEASAAWQQFERATAGQAAEPTWTAACRASELAETVRESLERGRVVAVYVTEHSEEKSFKGMMAISGCGLMLFVLAVLVVVAVVEGLKLPLAGWTVWRLWPLVLATGLIVFLGGQLVSFLFQKKPAPQVGKELHVEDADSIRQRIADEGSRMSSPPAPPLAKDRRAE